jgi:TBC1 domain family member 14
MKIVDVDLHRTFTDLAHFRSGEIFHQPLKNILSAFSMFRTDLGYVQGMSYVAGSLLLHIGDEYATF